MHLQMHRHMLMHTGSGIEVDSSDWTEKSGSPFGMDEAAHMYACVHKWYALCSLQNSIVFLLYEAVFGSGPQ